MSGIFDQIINYSPPLIVSGTVNYKGTWNASTNNPTLSASPASSTKGDYYVVSTAGTQFGITFAIGDWIISNGTAWEKVDLTDAVSSVFGRTGAVVGVSTDYSAVGLTNTAIGASNPSTGAFTTVTASSTISATGAVTGSNLSGTNTGDQTTITGNAGTATALQTARTIGGSSFDGTANVTSFPVPGAIGVTTPAAANFTSIGVTTQGTGAFTTGNFSSTLFAGGVTTLRGANVPIANNSGFLIVGSSDAAGADLGGSLGFTANTTSLANYPMGNISARLIATGAGVYRSYMAFATTTSAGAVNEYMRLTDAGLAVTGALSATGAIEGANVIRTNGPATADKAASAAIDYASGFHRAWCWGPNTSTLGQWKIRLVRSDGSAAVEPVSVSSTGLAVTGTLTTSSTTLHTSSVSLTNGAAAALGTLTNAPVAGNPTKWIPIVDNGVTRYIPCW